jgi:hypothetical protein
VLTSSIINALYLQSIINYRPKQDPNLLLLFANDPSHYRYEYRCWTFKSGFSIYYLVEYLCVNDGFWRCEQKQRKKSCVYILIPRSSTVSTRLGPCKCHIFMYSTSGCAARARKCGNRRSDCAQREICAVRPAEPANVLHSISYTTTW